MLPGEAPARISALQQLCAAYLPDGAWCIICIMLPAVSVPWPHVVGC